MEILNKVTLGYSLEFFYWDSEIVVLFGCYLARPRFSIANGFTVVLGFLFSQVKVFSSKKFVFIPSFFKFIFSFYYTFVSSYVSNESLFYFSFYLSVS
jgi:hypothetical protein